MHSEDSGTGDERRREGTLIVVGTGIQGGGQTTLAAQRAIEGADRVLFAVMDPLTVAWIRSLNPAAESLPYPMDDSPRRQTYMEMVARILAEVRKGLRVCAVFYGHPGVLAIAPHVAVTQARREGFRARMLPGVSAMDCLFADMGVDPGRDGCQIYDATDFLIRNRGCDVHSPLVLWQVAVIGNLGFFDEHDTARIRRGLTVLAEALTERYGAGHGAVIYEAAVLPTDVPRMDTVSLAELPGCSVSDISTLYVPPLAPAPLDARMLERLGMNVPRGAAGEGSLVADCNASTSHTARSS